MRATGIDISYWNGSYHYHEIDDFVIARASIGTMKDTVFDGNIGEIMKAPVRGAFHYMTSGAHWVSQADAFIKAVQPYDLHFYACDYEETNNTLSPTFASMTYEWMNYTKRVLNKPVVLYTRWSLYDQAYAWDARIQQFPLWLAQYPYSVNPQVDAPRMPNRPNGGWRIWQYSGDSPESQPLLHGVSNKSVELDVFNGSLNDMRVWLGLSKELSYEDKVDRLWAAHPELHGG